MKRFADIEYVADYVAEYIDKLGFYADDFDCGAIALVIAEAEDDGEHWRVSIDEKDFRELVSYFEFC